jgi:hypothetical protein
MKFIQASTAMILGSVLDVLLSTVESLPNQSFSSSNTIFETSPSYFHAPLGVDMGDRLALQFHITGKIIFLAP